jgi:hypothetical protein
MRRTRCWRGRSVAVGTLTLLAGLATMATPARAQLPQPKIADINERSGLISRFYPIEPNLPPDPHRDAFYDTRYGDAPNYRRFPNCIKNGGLYGLRWSGRCTAAFYPYFYGSPGNQITEGCKPTWFRTPRAFLHKPVCYYYDQGALVPLYDYDPIVPGPGAYPFPWFWRSPRGG